MIAKIGDLVKGLWRGRVVRGRVVEVNEYGVEIDGGFHNLPAPDELAEQGERIRWNISPENITDVFSTDIEND